MFDAGEKVEVGKRVEYVSCFLSTGDFNFVPTSYSFNGKQLEIVYYIIKSRLGLLSNGGEGIL